ncbi:MAG TPA: outer membrane beta-barrel protein [Candidatus Acidoferrales bacterium]|nr:outer membrane beta-barrel protein [Candidatus Acidoferrales bacterium]
MRFRFPALGKKHRRSLSQQNSVRSVFALASAAVLLMAISPPAFAQNFADDSRWELGGHYALLNLPSQCIGLTNCQSASSGFGGNLTYNLSPWISLDTEMDFFPDNGNPATAQTGGQVTEGLFGLRVGPTTRKWGFYSVLRPGFVSFGGVLNSGGTTSGLLGGTAMPRQFSATLVPRDAWRSPQSYSSTSSLTGSMLFRRDTDFALNYGEAIEFRATKHAALRFDIGDTIVTYPGGGSVLGPFKQHNFQISQALVIRF